MTNKAFATVVLLVVLTGLSLVGAEEVDSDSEKLRKEVWSEFHKVRYEMFGKFQKIDVYGEDTSGRRICYISDGVVYRYIHRDPNNKGKSHVERGEHAKVINPGINRITYSYSEKTRSGLFALWHYETLELMVGF